MRANDELGESQQYINFMCTIKNSSCEYSPHTAIDLTGVLKTANNIDVAPLSSSYECPGYESATAGIIDSFQIGQTKRIAIPYAVDDSETEYCIVGTNGWAPLFLQK